MCQWGEKHFQAWELFQKREEQKKWQKFAGQQKKRLNLIKKENYIEYFLKKPDEKL